MCPDRYNQYFGFEHLDYDPSRSAPEQTMLLRHKSVQFQSETQSKNICKKVKKSETISAIKTHIKSQENPKIN